MNAIGDGDGRGPRPTGVIAAALALAGALLLAFAGSAYGASGIWERAFGKDVVNGGGTGFEICTVASLCESGLSGTLGGEFSGPFAVAVDSGGNVYVADGNNNRIQKFDASGNFLRTWGKDVDAVAAGTGFEICTVAANCKKGETGSLGGELGLPVGVALDGAGSVYVVDFGNKRIQKFDSSGNFQRAWGKDVATGGLTGAEVCSTAASCKAGVNGDLGGEFNSPNGIGANPVGNVYVADANNNRIQKFDSAGNFQLTWGKDVDGGGSTGFEACSLAIGCKAGVAGALGGELNLPLGVAADSTGGVYVVDYGNTRMQKFDASGNFDRAWGKDVDTGGSSGAEICTVALNCKGANGGVLGGEFNLVNGVAVDPQGTVYASDAVNNMRIQAFDSSGNFQRAWGKGVDGAVAGTGFEICTVAANCLAGSVGGSGGELSSPSGLATDSAGNLYVGDSANQRIQRFSDTGPPSTSNPGGGGSTTPAGPTGQRDAALKKCKKKKSAKARKKCKRKAKKLPV